MKAEQPPKHEPFATGNGTDLDFCCEWHERECKHGVCGRCARLPGQCACPDGLGAVVRAIPAASS